MSKVSIGWFSKTFYPHSTARNILNSNPQHTTTAQRKWARKQWSAAHGTAPWIIKYMQTHRYNGYRTANQKNMLPIVTFEEFLKKEEKQAELRRERSETQIMQNEDPKIIRRDQQRQEQQEQHKQQMREQEQQKQQKQAEQQMREQKQAELMREQRERTMMNDEDVRVQRTTIEEEEHQQIFFNSNQRLQKRNKIILQQQELEQILEQFQQKREQRRQLERERIGVATRVGAKRQKEKEKRIIKKATITQAYPEAAIEYKEGQQERERQLQVRACELQKVRERVKREEWWKQNLLKYGVQDPLVERLKREHAKQIYHEYVVRIYRDEKERLRQIHQRGLQLEKAWLQLEIQEHYQLEYRKRVQEYEIQLQANYITPKRQQRLEQIRLRILDRIKQKAEK
jgi:hypothetical protein